MLSIAASAGGSRAAEPARSWRAITRVDIEAAHAMLLHDHPGASRDIQDADFQFHLENAYRKALRRSGKVSSFEGYTATLAGFATAMGDKHIWSRPLFNPDTRSWTGMLIARRPDKWVVSADANAEGVDSLVDAQLVSCDGVAADELARRQIGEFHAVWSVEAQRIQRAPWVLLDDGNPFVTRPKRCTFSKGGKSIDVSLKWRDISRIDLNAIAAKVPTRGKAGMGVRPVGGGWWIALESLSDEAQKVVGATAQHIDTIRNAPFVVVDLRGNDGGNSFYGQELARTILGDAFVRQGMTSDESARQCPKVWRASAGNLAHLAEIRKTTLSRAPAEVQRQFDAEYAALKAAATKGQDFAEKPCRQQAAQASERRKIAPPLPIKGKLFLLTDNSCFSSCLLVTDEFRQLGAIHVGEATDAATNYMEVREEVLPSGLSAFSTLQAVDTGAARSIGPFTPQLLFPGSIADTSALEQWIRMIATH